MAKVQIVIEDVAGGVQMKVLPNGVAGIAERIKAGSDVSDAEYYALKTARVFRDIVKIEQHNAASSSPIIIPKKSGL